jgi:hypothetical protein
MNWYVKKGDQFEIGKTVEWPFYANYGLHHPLNDIKIEMYSYMEGLEGTDGPPFKDLGMLSNMQPMGLALTVMFSRLPSRGCVKARFRQDSTKVSTEGEISRGRGLLQDLLSSHHDLRHHYRIQVKI